MRRREREPVKPKKIMDAAVRKQIQLEYLEHAQITARVFDLMDKYLGTTKQHSTRALDWLRPIAALSLRLGVDHEDIGTAIRAGRRGDWVTVDMLLLAHED